MKAVFLQILDMSVSASILAGAVMVLRLLLKKAPKYIHCILWAMVALRLVCTSLPESQVSVMPDSHPVSSVVQPRQQAPVTNVQPPVQAPQVSVPDHTVSVVPEPNKTVDWVEVFSVIWLSGVAILALYGMGSYFVLRRKVAPAVKEDGIWLCDSVASPFILGIFKPRIYLPSVLQPEYRASVLAHEKAHLRRKDHWWKPLGFALLAVHWFNPVMWIAYILLCRDIEAACDERVVKGMEPGDRKVYSEALLSCAVPRRSIAACPLAFGEQGVKGRIKSVLSYKKPAVWIILASVVASVAVGVFFLTNPSLKPGPGEGVVYFELFAGDIMTNGEIPNPLIVTRRNAIISKRELDTLMREMEDKHWLELSKYDTIIDVTYRVTVDPKTVGISPCVYYMSEESWEILTVRDGKLFFADVNRVEMDLFRKLKERAMEGGKIKHEPELVMDMTIVHSVPSSVAFEEDCFYATDSDGKFYRVYCNDMTGLSEGKLVRVIYSSDSLRELEYPNGYPDGGYTPKYEVTAIKAEPLPAQNEYVSMVYFIQEDAGHYWGAPNLEGAKYYAIPVTAEERDTLLKLEEGRVWQDTRLSSSLPVSHMTMNVVVDGSWNFFSVNDDRYIVKERYYAVLTQEERDFIKALKSRAFETTDAQNYFTDDWLVYQQKTKQSS